MPLRSSSPQGYAVFENRNHISAMTSSGTAIREHGLADAGFQAADGPAFERYGGQFKDRTRPDVFEIPGPVR